MWEKEESFSGSSPCKGGPAEPCGAGLGANAAGLVQLPPFPPPAFPPPRGTCGCSGSYTPKKQAAPICKVRGGGHARGETRWPGLQSNSVGGHALGPNSRWPASGSLSTSPACRQVIFFEKSYDW